MPTTIDWPTTRAFLGSRIELGLAVNEALARGFYTGNVVSQRSSQADRMTCLITLPACNSRTDAADRDGLVFRLRSERLWVRLGMWHRPVPVGTLRGTPTATSAVVAGATTIPITTTAGATLRGGDFLGCGTNTLIMVGYPGATANGSGLIAACPLAMPIPVALSLGASLIWDNPLGLWEWDGDDVRIEYTPRVIQQPIVLPLRQVISS